MTGLHITNNGSLRAAILGANDGLVSNFILVMGVAGGSNNPKFVLLAGIAGLFAGAFSMAAGEYVSMRSQRDVYEYQIARETSHITDFPQETEETLVEIYQTKGLSKEVSLTVARNIMATPETGLDTIVKEKLGLNPLQLGSPWGASLSSFFSFSIGAIIPIAPYFFITSNLAITLSSIFSVTALFLVGATVAIVSSKNVFWGALRMSMAGGAAAAVTFIIGNLVGTSIIG